MGDVVTPQFPPKVLAVLCGQTMNEQSRHSGLARRQFMRLIKAPWEKWRVEKAQSWCAGCGVDFFDLRLDSILPRVDLRSASARMREALSELYKIGAKSRPNAAQLRQFVDLLEKRKAGLK